MNTSWSEVEAALDQSGIGHDIVDRLHKHHEEIGNWAGALVRRASNQAAYDLIRNVPAGIMSRAEATPERAVHVGLVGTCGAFVKWDPAKALELCADILEDVNAHQEAAAVRKMIDGL